MKRLLDRRIVGCAVALVCLIATSVPAGAGPVTAHTSVDAGHRLEFQVHLERLERLGVPTPLLDSLARAQQSETFSDTVTFSEAAGDLDRDGGADAFITTVDYEITIGWGATGFSPSIEEKATSRAVAVAGRTGKVLWTKTWNDMTIPIPARVGKNDRDGAIALSGLMSLIGPFENRRLVIDGLDGRSGKRLWRSKHQSVETSAYPAWAGHDVPVSLSLFDGVRGRSKDLLLGVAEVAFVGAAFTTASQAIVIDGRTGKEKRHPTVDVGINWIVQPMPTADLDDDGLDDYVVPLDASPHLGGGQDPPGLDGVVHARGSTRGEDLWTESGFDLNWLAWVFPMPDVVGSKTRDLAIMTLEEDEDAVVIGGVYFGEIEWATYLVDGKGIKRWKRWGGWPHSPGNLDGDHRPDVVTRDFLWNFSKGALTYKTRAYRVNGSTRWKRNIVSRYEPGPCRAACSAGVGSGAGFVGDIDSDGRRETYVRHEVQQNPGEDPTFSIIVDGKTGKRMRSGGEELHAPGISFGGRGTDLVEVEVNGASATVRGRDGATFRLLWETEIALNGLRTGKRWIWATGASFDGDRCGDLLLSINVDRDAVSAAISGGTGKLLWQRASKKDIRITQPAPPVDRNRTC